MTSGWSHTPRWHASVLSLAVFLIPAFSLALPTGYSWGAALLVLLGLLAWPQVLRHPQTLPTELRWWALATLGMGRAHHRVLHFVGRAPGIKVGELLAILDITKQSLGRVLTPLVEDGFVTQSPGRNDRRQRLLSLTEKGAALERKLGWIGNTIQTLLSLIQARRALGLEAAVVVLVGIEVVFTLYEHVIRPLWP